MSQIIDNSVRALQQQAAATAKAAAQLAATLDGQVAEIQTNANTLADQEATIAANKAAVETQVREAKAEIRLQVKEDRKTVLSQLLAEEGLVATTRAEIDASNEAIQAAEAKAARTEFDAVKAAESKLHARYGSELSELRAEHKVELATYTANAQRDKEIIDGLRKQVESLEATIVANREAETARTQAMAQSSVTVNNGK